MMDKAAAMAPKENLQDFHRELEQLLRKQLQQQPGLQDVRLKLLELFYEQRRGADFLAAARPLRQTLKNPETSREWQRVASMGRMLLPGEPLFSGHDSETIEFVADIELPAAAAPKKVQRFGDEERYRPLFEGLSALYEPVRQDVKFLAELELLLVGLPTRRPTPLIPVRRLSQHVGGAQIYFKREDLAGENPHLLVAVSGQALLALRLGRQTLVTGTSDGRRGVAVAAIGARLGMQTVVYMDSEQAQRAAGNLLHMKLLGARVELVKAVKYRNRDVREAALEHWSKDPNGSFLVTGLDAAPSPYPLMTREFTAAIGRECRRQMSTTGRRMPDVIATRGSNTADALGLLPAFLADREIRLVCVEPETDQPRAKTVDPFTQIGMPLTQTEKKVAQSIMDRLEYPSVAREHAWLKASGRVEYVRSSRAATRAALQDLARLEAVVAPVETAHVVAWACEAARGLPASRSVVVVMAESPATNNLWDISRLLEEPSPR